MEEPELCYQRRLTAARPSGFFRDALRTYAGMLSRLRWLVPLPDSLSRVLTDVDGNGTDLGVFLFLADLLSLRDAGCLLLQLVPRSVLLNWQLPTEAGVAAARASGPERIVWREPRITPQPPNGSGNQAVPVVVLDACGAVAPDPQAWLYRSLAVTDDGLLLSSWLAEPNPADPSDYEDLLARTALPVGVRTGMVCHYGFSRVEGDPSAGGVAGQRPQRLVLSSSSFMDLPEGVTFRWEEIAGGSLAEHRAYLQQLEEGMRRDALIPSAGVGPARSELEVMPLVPSRRPQPSVAEWLVLQERGVISSDELRQQLGVSVATG